MKINQIASICFVGCVLALMAGCAEQPAVPSAVPCHGATCRLPEYLIGPGDVLHISVWKENGLDQVVTVRPDGMISFPMVNDVRAAGYTPMQLQTSISEKLKQYVSVPEVSVVVQSIHSFAVYVLGNVIHPGRYELTGQATVLDVLARAGGLNVFASTSNIEVIRNQGSKSVHIPFDYDDAVSKDDGEVFYLLSGDIIMVP